MRAFSAAWASWLAGAFMVRPILQNKTGPGSPVPSRTGPALPAPFDYRRLLLDCDRLARRRGLLRQRQFEHTVAELRLGFRLIQLLRQREAARHLAEHALAVQHALAFGGFLLALDFRCERQLSAVDVDVNVFFLHSR